jgi:hypothetical protein
LTGPSGGWVPGSTFQYGNGFIATCNKPGTALLGLQLTAGQGGAPTTPIDGYNYTGIDAYAPSTQTNGLILPLGGQLVVSSTRLPQYNVTVNCNALGNLTIE